MAVNKPLNKDSDFDMEKIGKRMEQSASSFARTVSSVTGDKPEDLIDSAESAPMPHPEDLEIVEDN